MFRCEIDGCGVVTTPRQPVNRVVTRTRERTYEKVHKRGKMKGTVEFIKGSEIVEERSACPECYERLTGETALKYIPPPPVVIEEEAEEERPKKKRRRGKKWINPKAKGYKGPKQGKFRKQVEQDKKKPVVEVVNKLEVVKETTSGTKSSKSQGKSGRSKNRNRGSRPGKKPSSLSTKSSHSTPQQSRGKVSAQGKTQISTKAQGTSSK